MDCHRVLIMWLSTVAKPLAEDADEAAFTPFEQRFAMAAGFEEVVDLVSGRCSMCHSVEPAWEGMIKPPKGVMFETEQQIARYAREIYLQAGRSRAMPPPNAIKSGVGLEPAERQLLVLWYESALGDS